jgi:hypothetical protein
MVTAFRSDAGGLGGLSSISCASDGPLSFDVEAGRTYRVQVSNDNTYGYGARLDLSLRFLELGVVGVAPNYELDAPVDITVTSSPGIQPTCSLVGDLQGEISTSCDLHALAWQLGGPGGYTVTASATDSGGQTATSSRRFDIVASYRAVKAFTNAWVTKAGIAAQLVGYLDAAAKAEARGSLNAEASNLESYRSLLKAQGGKSVTTGNARRLIEYSFGL